MTVPPLLNHLILLRIALDTKMDKIFIPLIVWEKWIDPFGEDHEETKWINYNKSSEYEDDEEDGDTFSDDSAIKLPEKPIKVIASPLGLIPYNEYTASSKIFNFWIGHTNFNISNIISTIIEDTEGVEILDIFTRYRFRIAIGKCFEDSEVMNTINTNVYQNFTT